MSLCGAADLGCYGIDSQSRSVARSEVFVPVFLAMSFSVQDVVGERRRAPSRFRGVDSMSAIARMAPPEWNRSLSNNKNPAQRPGVLSGR